MNLRIMTCLACLLLFFSLQLHAQNHSLCGPSPVPLSNDCAGACLVCDLNGTSARTSNTTPGQSPPGFCTMIVHSMQWLAFVAGSVNLSINVAVSNCMQANGVEMGIYASMDCNSFTLVSNCNTNMFANQTWNFTNTAPLKPGCIYYLVWDGNGPNECDLFITVASGSASAPTPNTTDKIKGRTLVCKGETVKYSINPIFGACEYEWRAVNGSIVSENANEVEILWENPGPGKVCVKGRNACKEGNEVCLDVLVGDDSPPQDLGPFYVCRGQSYRFGNEFFAPGFHTKQYKNIYGCDSILNITVEEILIDDGALDTTLCWPQTLVLGNKRYDSTGIYVHLSKSRLPPFCDSSVLLTLTMIRAIPVPLKSGDLSCTNSSVVLSVDSSAFDTGTLKTYYWISSKGDTLGSNQSIIVDKAGIYTLKFVTKTNAPCQPDSLIQVRGSINPPRLIQKSNLERCLGDSIFLDSIPFFDSQQTGAPISFHRSPRCDSSDIILQSRIILDRDTIIYIKAESGSCRDVLPFPLKTIKTTFTQPDTIRNCIDALIRLGDHRFQWQGPDSSAIRWYSCPDTSCLLNINSWILNRDTTLFIYPTGARCPGWSSLHLEVIPSPVLDLQADKTLLCVNDSIRLFWNREPGVEYMLERNGTDSLIAATVDTLVFRVPNSARQNFCFRARREICNTRACLPVDVRDPLPMPQLRCFPSDTEIRFSWNADSLVEYRLEYLSGHTAQFTSDSLVIFSGLQRGEEVRIRLIRLDSVCGDRALDLNCQAVSCPPRTIRIEQPGILCLGSGTDTIHLQVNIDSAQTGGSWSFTGPGIMDSTQAIFSTVQAGKGLHRIRVEYFSAGCRYFDFVQIAVREKPLARFLLDSIVCQDSFALLRFTGRKEDSTRLDWEYAQGISRNISKDLWEIKWDRPGKKRLKLKILEESCLDESELETDVWPPLEKPELVCNPTDSSVTFIWKKNARVKKYLVQILKGSQGTMISDTSYFIKLSGPSDTIRIRILAEDSGPCSDALSEDLSCQPTACPPLKLLQDSTIAFCDGSVRAIYLRDLIQQALPVQQFIGPGIFQDSVITDRIAYGPSLYVLKSTRDQCLYLDSFYIIKRDLPQIAEFIIEPIPCSLSDSTGTIEISRTVRGASPYEYSINHQGFGKNTLFQPLSEGKYILEVRDRFGCISDTIAELIRPDLVDLELGPDIEIIKGSQVELAAAIQGKYLSLLWDGWPGLVCDSCKIIRFTPDRDLLMQATVYNEAGCKDEDQVWIRLIDQDIYAPNVFSPNGDQINDHFTLFGGSGALTIQQLMIFDRWGERVFETRDIPLNDPVSGWDGNFRGQKTPPGVYVYYAKVSRKIGPEVELYGEFSLMR